MRGEEGKETRERNGQMQERENTQAETEKREEKVTENSIRSLRKSDDVLSAQPKEKGACVKPAGCWQGK